MALNDDHRDRIEAEERARRRVRVLLEQGPVVIRVARGCRSGFGCVMSLITLAVILAIVLSIGLFFTGGDSAGKASCERFYEFTEIAGEAEFNYEGLLRRVTNVRDLAEKADADIRLASDMLFAAVSPDEKDIGRIIAAASAMGAACSDAGYSP